MNPKKIDIEAAYKIQSDAKSQPTYLNSALKKLDDVLEEESGYFADEKYDSLLKDLQAHILLHHKKRYVTYYFLAFEESADLKSFITQIAPYLTSAKNQYLQKKLKKRYGRLEGNNNILTLSLTGKGYADLAIPERLIPNELKFSGQLTERVSFPNQTGEKDEIIKKVQLILMYASDVKGEDFVFQVSALRKHSNGSADESDPEDQPPGKNAFVGATVGKRSIIIDKDWKWEKCGISCNLKNNLLFHSAGILENPLPEHLRFNDGIGNPIFLNYEDKSFKNLPLGIVIGKDSLGDPPAPCGSYGAFIDFRFKEESISHFIELAKKAGLSGANDEPAKIALAHLFGRFPDGTPLAKFPEEGNPTNAFDYRQDPNGLKCPFHTHVRKANPRNAISQTKQIARRGVYYHTDKGEKGLLFHSYQSSLIDQFEYIVNNWLLNIRPSEAVSADSGDTHLNSDILFSNSDARDYHFPKKWGKDGFTTITPQDQSVDSGPFVESIFGLYFYTPPLSFLRKCDKIKIDIKPIVLKPKKPVDNPPVLENVPIQTQDIPAAPPPPKRDPLLPPPVPDLHKMHFKREKFFSIKTGNRLGPISTERKNTRPKKSKHIS